MCIRDSLESLQKRLSREVLGLGEVTDLIIDIPEYLVHVLIVEHAERLRVSALGLFNQTSNAGIACHSTPRSCGRFQLPRPLLKAKKGKVNLTPAPISAFSYL